ncbi:hypothetical protein KC19_VG116100 [Ceratodon purpureus]|uniref:peptidyl-tRNA hydrolase n=1 Tax=Ceratodon purpureus TaxID=3225 RepID=A0A8T0HPJ4_CERPU|nr:hypothetical protein KC19_VG116100 [Ceratodon purpureus]
MSGSRSNDRGRSHSPARERQAQPWLAKALNPASLLPGMVIGFLLGLWVEFPKGGFKCSLVPAKKGSVGSRITSLSSDEGGEMKMVFVVRQDLKMGSGKIASQCAHAATGIYNDLLNRNRNLLKRWEDGGQPKIVVTCKNQKEMNELRGRADGTGLPTYTVADAGRTQVAVGSKTVLVIGPGSKASVDSVTRHLRLL